MARRTRQLASALEAPRGWGGRRVGAGRKRKPGASRTLPHVSRARFKTLPAHLTLRLRSDTPSLRTSGIVHAIERTFVRGCVRPGFRLAQYSLQGTHVHLIVEAQDRDALGCGMKAIGSRIARAVNRIARRTGPVLADRYHLRLLPTPKEVRAALRYVLLNSRRHLGRVRAMLTGVRLDPASSARWFDGWTRESLLGMDEGSDGARARPPVARPRTWLLAVGWRRHGLLDPGDVPG